MGTNADQVIETFGCGAEENQIDSLRHGQVVNLPAEGEVWLAGDIHDHRRNWEKLIYAADLPNNPQRHLVLQELIHGDHWDANGAEGSWEMLSKAAELKCDHPGQVHFLLANHDLAQIYGEGILKGGQSVCEAFNAGVRRDFGTRYDVMTAAITDFLLSFPLAARTPNGLFFTHSLPTDAEVARYDFSVFDRALTGADYQRRTGPAYQLIWGRRTTAAAAEQFAQNVGAELLVTGHQPQESGYLVNGAHHLIIASDHSQGVFLPVDLSASYDIESLTGSLRKFAGVDG